MEVCPFCPSGLGPEVVLSNDGCLALWATGGTAGSSIVVPRAHRTSPFELTGEEMVATISLLSEMKALVDRSHSPDGWNVGWNVGRVGGQEVEHVHCHLIARYADEPYAGRGIRWWLKQPENRRPHSS